MFRVQWLPGGEVRLVTNVVADHADLATLLPRLVTVVNEYAVATHGCLGLHAGAVRSPGGHIVVLPGVSGAGKSTLTAALVATGWDYLGDEVAGIDGHGNTLGYPKRLALDPSSRRVLGLPPDAGSTIDPGHLRPGVARLAGRIGPAAAVVFPTYRPGPVEVEELDVDERFDALLAHTLNLARTGQRGLESLCGLAESAPMFRLGHQDAFEAAARITDLVG